MIPFLLLRWKLLVIVGAVGGALAFAAIQTFRLKNAQLELQEITSEYRTFVAATKSAGEIAAKAKEAYEAHAALVHEEMTHEIEELRARRTRERAASADRYSKLYGRWFELHAAGGSGSSGGGMSEAGAGSPDAVRTRCFNEQKFLAGLRGSLGAAYGELEQIVRRGEDAVDDRQAWAKWARLAGACDSK